MRRVITGAAALALSGVLAAVVLAGTVNGTAKNDNLRGSAQADTINGKAGNDKLYGLAGNDKLVGGAGNDLLVGGAGADNLNCGPGNDRANADGLDVVSKSCEVVKGRPSPAPPPPPPPAPPAPPPPPPPPAYRTGSYAGTTAQGKSINFNVSADAKQVVNVKFGFDVNCTEVQGFTINDTAEILVPLAIGSDGTFSISDSASDSDSKLTFEFNGKLTAPSSASGGFKLALEVYDIPGVGTLHCQTGSEPVTWNAS